MRISPLVLAVLLALTVVPSVEAAANGTVTERTYKRLSRAHALMEAGRFDDALTHIEFITTSRVRPYEHALVLQTYGYLYAAMSQYAPAIDALHGSLATDALPLSASKNALYLLAQMQLAAGRYSDAVASVQRWLALEREPTPKANALAGAIYALAKSYDRAIEHLKRAIRAAEQPQENWFRQLVALRLETKQYRDAASILEEMVIRYPKRKAYWLQLAGVYQALKDDNRALAVMELAYRQELPFDQRELLNLINFLLYMEIPYKAGTLLEAALEKGTVHATVENWQLLSNTWLGAREFDLALAALARALEIAPDAEILMHRAQIAAELNYWPIVLQSIDRALELGGVSRPGTAYLLKGVAHFNLDHPHEASQAFQQAKSYEQSRDRAAQWLTHIARERRTVALLTTTEAKGYGN